MISVSYSKLLPRPRACVVLLNVGKMPLSDKFTQDIGGAKEALMKIPPGAATVGHLNDLNTTARVAVFCIRNFNGEQPLALALAPVVGNEDALTVAEQFLRITAFLQDHGRRALMCHSPNCMCLGADEALFAHFVTMVEAQEREEAFAAALLLIRADMAPCALALAEPFILAIRRGLTRSARKSLETQVVMGSC